MWSKEANAWDNVFVKVLGWMSPSYQFPVLSACLLGLLINNKLSGEMLEAQISWDYTEFDN